MTVYFAFFLAIVIAFPAYGHPGKTDRDGGHKCYKECAEWNLYYAEYHLHDKDGKAVKVARKKPVRPKPEAAPAAESPVLLPADRPVDPATAQPVAAAAAVEPCLPSLPGIVLMLLLLLFLIVRRNRRTGSDAKQADISK